MGIDIEVYKYKYKELKKSFMELPGVNDEDLLTKIMLEFGEVIGDYYIVLDNDYYEDGDCFYNLSNMIDGVFKTENSFDVLLEQRESLLSYKELYEAYENLGLEEPEEEEEW